MKPKVHLYKITNHSRNRIQWALFFSACHYMVSDILTSSLAPTSSPIPPCSKPVSVTSNTHLQIHPLVFMTFTNSAKLSHHHFSPSLLSTTFWISHLVIVPQNSLSPRHWGPTLKSFNVLSMVHKDFMTRMQALNLIQTSPLSFFSYIPWNFLFLECTKPSPASGPLLPFLPLQ